MVSEEDPRGVKLCGLLIQLAKTLQNVVGIDVDSICALTLQDTGLMSLKFPAKGYVWVPLLLSCCCTFLHSCVNALATVFVVCSSSFTSYPNVIDVYM